MTPPKSLPAFYSCGICGAYHPADWDGDCREDAARFSLEDLESSYADGWIEVPMPEPDSTDAYPGQNAWKREAEPRRRVCYWLGGAHKVAREPVFVCLDLHEANGELLGDTRAVEIPKEFEGQERRFAALIADAFAQGAGVHPEDVTYDEDSTLCFADV